MIGLVVGALAQPISLEEALDEALAANLELARARRGNAIVRYRLQQARLAFGPRLWASVGLDQRKTPSNQATDVAGPSAVVTTGGAQWAFGLGATLPTNGTVSVSLSENRTTTDSANALSDTFVSTQASMSVEQPLLRGAAFGALSDLRDAQLERVAQELRWRDRVERTVLEVARAYWGLLSARESLAIAERGVELARVQLAETTERLEAGFAGSGDVLQVQVALGQAERGAVVARADVGDAEQRLARLLGRPLDATLELADLPEPPEQLPQREELLQSARAHNAAFALARIELERARRAARRARNGALPDLTLSGWAAWSAGGTDPAQVRPALIENPAPSAGMQVRLGLPLLPQEARATVAIAGLELERAELAFEAAEVDLVIAVDGVLRDLHRDLASLRAARQTSSHARASLEAQRDLLAEGRGSTRDVVVALEGLRTAEIAELEAKIALQSSLLRARRVAGTLVTAEAIQRPGR